MDPSINDFEDIIDNHFVGQDIHHDDNGVN
jgi:hypothetical protein